MIAGDTGMQAATKSRIETEPTNSTSKQDQGRSAPKSRPKCDPRAGSKPTNSKSKQDQGRPAPKSRPKFDPRAQTKLTFPKSKPDQGRSASKLEPEPKLEPKAEAKSSFPGQPLDGNIKIQPIMDNVPDEMPEDSTVISTASPVDDTLIRYETFGANSKAPSAFQKANRGYQSAGFRKKNKNISAGPAFVGFHLGKCDTSPSKIEGPNWLKKATERVTKIFKSQNRKVEPAHASPVCKLTENIVKEVRAVQQGETAVLQKSVITNVPMSHSFPGISFTTHGQETADKWSEQFPNVFPQQEAEEDMDKKAELHCRSPSRLGEQTPTKKPVDEVEPDPWPKKHTADVAEADQVDEEKSQNNVFNADSFLSSPVAELSKSFGGLSLSVA